MKETEKDYHQDTDLTSAHGMVRKDLSEIKTEFHHILDESTKVSNTLDRFTSTNTEPGVQDPTHTAQLVRQNQMGIT